LPEDFISSSVKKISLMASCKSCGQALVLELDPDDFDEATSSVVGGSPTVVPDDLELPCSCHFHWYVVL
jgi:hypothetical protein